MKTPAIMGILNVTPNSFSDGGDYKETKKAIAHAMEMIEHGASIIDIGGESTRPGAEDVSLEDELSRTIPVLKELNKLTNGIIFSIDTTKYEVAKQALDCGATIINDVSALESEPKFVDLASEYNADLVLMHRKGSAKTMQDNPTYDNVVHEVYEYLENQSKLAAADTKVYVDVGIGFGKTLNHNLDLLRNLDQFNNITGKQVLGISRKSFFKSLLSIENPKDRDVHTAIIHALLLNKQVDVVRVHNVKLISDTLKIAEALTN